MRNQIVSVCFLLLFYSFVSGEANFNHIKPKVDLFKQQHAVEGLIQRLIPERYQEFEVHIDPTIGPPDRDTFQVVRKDGEKVVITGTSAIAAASGFQHYLKYHCLCHVSWQDSQLDLPETLPNINASATSNDRFRYYQNVCTTSYSFVWWDWAQWERHIDWMALNSYNLVLAMNGQEYVWKKVYRDMNLTDEEIDEHFTGPAFLSWLRMGNVRGWGGPLSDSWHSRSVVLQKKILERMREFGITPVLPAFNGYVPKAFSRLYPNARFVAGDRWNDFNDTYCCPLLVDPTDPLFRQVGTAFLQEYIAEFGTDHIYTADTFNEVRPANGSTEYLSEMGKSVFSAMTSVDDNAVWLMQNWLFVHDSLFWTEDRAKALLTSVPQGRMIVLDLQSEQFPMYKTLHSYYGQPYIWSMLHNFGGTLGMFGSAEIINTEIFKARSLENSTLVGTGITPEGINQNYVIYDLMTEMAWRKNSTDLKTWFFQYSFRRYGGRPGTNPYIYWEAWDSLRRSVYDFQNNGLMRGKYAVNRRPSLKIKLLKWYNLLDIILAWEYLVTSADIDNVKQFPTYQYDLVDVTRQALQAIGDMAYVEIVNTFERKQLSQFREVAAGFLGILEDMEKILGTNKHFLLGTWLRDAKNAASDPREAELFEYNARNQITLWGPNGEIVDYANKQWSGIVSHFLLPRWSLYLGRMNQSLATNTKFDERAATEAVFEQVEKPFTFDRSVFPVTPTGDTAKIASELYAKYCGRGKKFDRVRTNEIVGDADEPTIELL